MTNTVSIILPVYKIAPALLRACVDSLVNQTYQDLQIILVDDGSPDSCGEICDQLEKIDSRIETHHIPNSGVSAARNKGMEQAIGSYICFVDPDDKLKEDCIEQALKAATELSSDILLFKNTDDHATNFKCTLRRECCTDKDIDQLIACTLLQKNTDFNAGACWCKLYNRSFLTKHNLRFTPGVVKAQDRLFVFDCYLQHPCVAQLDYVGYIYTINEESICHKFNPHIIRILENTASEFRKRLRNNIKYRSLEYGMLMMFIYEYYQLYFLHAENAKTIFERTAEIKSLCRKSMYQTAIKKASLGSIRKKCALLCLFLKCRMYKLSLIVMKKMID